MAQKSGARLPTAYVCHMGRGRSGGKASALVYSPQRRQSGRACSAELLDETLMRITRQLDGASDLEFWDSTISPDDIRRKYSRYDEMPDQQRARIRNLVARFRLLELEGMIGFAYGGESPAHNRYRLTAMGMERGAHLVWADDIIARERVVGAGTHIRSTTQAASTPIFAETDVEELRSRASERGPEGVSTL